jgi:preprotein translocase subunit SecA
MAHKALFGDRLAVDIANMIYDISEKHRANQQDLARLQKTFDFELIRYFL